jgi:hypothetical protein
MGRYGQAGKLMDAVATGNRMKALELVVRKGTLNG